MCLFPNLTLGATDDRLSKKRKLFKTFLLDTARLHPESSESAGRTQSHPQGSTTSRVSKLEEGAEMRPRRFATATSD